MCIPAQLSFQSRQHSEKSSCGFNRSWHQVASVWLHCRVEWEKWTQQGTFPFEKYNAVSKNSHYQCRFISTLQNISPNHWFSPHPTPNTSYQFQHWLSQSLIGAKTFSFSHWRVIGDHAIGGTFCFCIRMKRLPPVMFNSKYLENEWRTDRCGHLSQGFQRGTFC